METGSGASPCNQCGEMAWCSGYGGKCFGCHRELSERLEKFRQEWLDKQANKSS